MKETLILTLTKHGWKLEDCAGRFIGWQTSRESSEQYAKDMNYRLQIDANGKLEWFN